MSGGVPVRVLGCHGVWLVVEQDFDRVEEPGLVVMLVVVGVVDEPLGTDDVEALVCVVGPLGDGRCEPCEVAPPVGSEDEATGGEVALASRDSVVDLFPGGDLAGVRAVGLASVPAEPAAVMAAALVVAGPAC